ncbi:hypothetical protein ACQJBY_026903 [Aegilops geniculata]
MDPDCFNMVVRKFMFDDIQTAKKKKGLISKDYLDMQFWMITDFGRHPNFRKELDVEQLAYSVHSWPGFNYNISACKSYIPMVISSSSYWTKIHMLSIFWILPLSILSTNTTHTQNICTDLYGLQNIYRKQCQRHALGLDGMRIFSYGGIKL